MTNFYNLLSIINEAPATPAAPASAPSEAPPSSAPAGSASQTPSLGSSGGGLGSSMPAGGGMPPGLNGPSGPSGMPDLSMGSSPDQSNSSKSGPVSPTKIKSINVWSALEKLISSKKSNEI